MGNSVKDGGPAFPSGTADIGDGDKYPYFTGMSLRDWFAGQALAGILAGRNPKSPHKANDTQFADAAYSFADAMLAQRKEASDDG